MCDQKTLDEVIRMKLAEALKADPSFVVSKKDAEERRRVKYKDVWFEIGRGHAYRDHRTGPTTNPRYSGPDKAVESAIMDDILARAANGGLPKVSGIASPGPAVMVHGTPIRYCAVLLNATKATEDMPYYMVSDYMVWQESPLTLNFRT